MSGLVRFSAAAFLASMLAGCATVHVQRVATDGPEAAFELQGARLDELEAEAWRLCPNGYETKRRSQHYQHLEGDPLTLGTLWEKTSRGLSTPTYDQAQLAVVCKPAPALPATPRP